MKHVIPFSAFQVFADSASIGDDRKCDRGIEAA